MTTCATCKHKTTRRMRGYAFAWCALYGRKADVQGCIDHKTKPTVAQALAYLAAISIK